MLCLTKESFFRQNDKKDDWTSILKYIYVVIFFIWTVTCIANYRKVICLYTKYILCINKKTLFVLSTHKHKQLFQTQYFAAAWQVQVSIEISNKKDTQARACCPLIQRRLDPWGQVMGEVLYDAVVGEVLRWQWYETLLHAYCCVYFKSVSCPKLT